MLKIAIDTYYRSEKEAYTVGVIFKDWSDKEPLQIIEDVNTCFGRYIPGEFYRRELPCILGILNKINLIEFDTIILDGFIRLKELDSSIRPGLGEHLKDELESLNLLHSDLDIVGIAKSNYCNTDEISYKLVRNNAKPLYCQSMRGNQLNFLESMDGPYRIPTLLKILDKQTKV